MVFYANRTAVPGSGGEKALRAEAREAELHELERGVRRTHGRGPNPAAK